jgi:hypothetical protein
VNVQQFLEGRTDADDWLRLGVLERADPKVALPDVECSVRPHMREGERLLPPAAAGVDASASDGDTM